MNKAEEMYKSVDLTSEILDADPHRLVQLLMENFLSRLNAAKGFMERRNYKEKAICIDKAVAILNGLILSLDREKGGEIAEVLYELYRYILGELVKANMKNDPMIIEGVKGVMQNIKEGWDAIPQDVKDKYALDVQQRHKSCIET